MTKSEKAFRVAVLGCLLLVAGWARAEDTRHKWQFGFGLSAFSTEDDIRSDADLVGCTGNPPVCTDFDPRPDRNVLNENSIQDNVKYDFSVSYGVTRFFALELAAGYFKGHVEKLETFREFQGFNPQTNEVQTQTLETNQFIRAAELREVPIQLSGLIRFRPESPFAPYVGLGIGYVFTDLTNDQAFGALNDQINLLQQSDIDGPVGPDGILALDPDPGLPASLQEEPNQSQLGVITDPIQITVNNGMTFSLRGGVDYYFTKHFSLFIDGTYTFADPTVEIRVAGSKAGQITVREVFATGVNTLVNGNCVGLDPKGDCFFGPRVFETLNGIQVPRQATVRDTCKDFKLSGLAFSLPECLGDDLNNNFIQDPGEEVGVDGFFNRTFGVCVGNCSGFDGAGNPVDPIYEARQIDDAVAVGNLQKICIGGDCLNFPGVSGPDVFEYIFTDSALGFSKGNPFQISPADDLVGSNNFIIQGGDIDLEGFSLGLGVKFTF